MSEYSERFQSQDAAANYDGSLYADSGWDAFIWSLERQRLRQIFLALRRKKAELTHLDFACGTGRILKETEPLCAHSIGIDISESMIERAREKLTRSELRVGDIRLDPSLLEPQFDVITAFRFFLNAEAQLRGDVLRLLARRLAGVDSRLIFNNHGNRHSVRHLAIEKRRRRGESHSEMSIREMTELTDSAGLEILELHGFGVCPSLLYRGRLGSAVKVIDRVAAALPFMRRVSYDVIAVCGRRLPVVSEAETSGRP